ncbi:hypothetical protein LCGC14_0681580 [marine sediment metagenome]|uniref:Uncharacterized protein n=1 Tax=marine sediment metagenome TaxID=412755 RepID=A0A0F9TW54_9ZZZZ
MRHRIKWGMPVETTPLAIKKNIFPKHRKGVCLGTAYGRFRRNTLCIVVVCGGQVTPYKYHHSFWKKST